jgi:hypothetical protein
MYYENKSELHLGGVGDGSARKRHPQFGESKQSSSYILYRYIIAIYSLAAWAWRKQEERDATECWTG